MDRGIEEETAVSSRLGVVADPLPGHENYRGRIVIPYLDQNDSPLTIRFRCAQNHKCEHPKYLSLPEDPVRVYNVRAIHRATDTIHITEGEFDAMILEQLGLHATSMPGAANWKGHHRRMFAGFSRVWVWGDPDSAGMEFNQRVCRSLNSARSVRLRDGDVTDMYLQGGEKAILELIGEG